MASRAPDRPGTSRAARGLLLLLLALGLALAAPTAVAASAAVTGVAGVSAVPHDATVLPGRTAGLDPAPHSPVIADVPPSTDPALAPARQITPADAVTSYRTRSSVTSRGPPAH